MGEILEALLQVRSKWYDAGMKLKVPVDTLDGIEARYDDPKDQLREMLKSWLKGAVKSQPTWKALVEMLRSSLVDEPRMADQLEGKYCPSPDGELEIQGQSRYIHWLSPTGRLTLQHGNGRPHHLVLLHFHGIACACGRAII